MNALLFSLLSLFAGQTFAALPASDCISALTAHSADWERLGATEGDKKASSSGLASFGSRFVVAISDSRATRFYPSQKGAPAQTLNYGNRVAAMKKPWVQKILWGSNYFVAQDLAYDSKNQMLQMDREGVQEPLIVRVGDNATFQSIDLFLAEEIRRLQHAEIRRGPRPAVQARFVGFLPGTQQVVFSLDLIERVGPAQRFANRSTGKIVVRSLTDPNPASSPLLNYTVSLPTPPPLAVSALEVQTNPNLSDRVNAPALIEVGMGAWDDSFILVGWKDRGLHAISQRTRQFAIETLFAATDHHSVSAGREFSWADFQFVVPGGAASSLVTLDGKWTLDTQSAISGETSALSERGIKVGDREPVLLESFESVLDAPTLPAHLERLPRTGWESHLAVERTTQRLWIKRTP